MIISTNGIDIIVDEDDYERVRAATWSRTTTGQYAKTTIYSGEVKHTVLLHNFIMGQPMSGLVWDHVNGSGLDNRKSNLRLARPEDNILNKKKYKNNSSGKRGISRHPYGWQAQIGYRRNRFWSLFKSFEDACKWRLKMEEILFGDFSPAKCRGEL